MMRRASLLLAIFALASLTFAQKKVLDPSVYDGWRTVRNVGLSTDGKWVMFLLAPQDGDAVLEVKATDGSKVYTVERGSNPQFTDDGKFVIATVLPKNDEVKKARRAKAKLEDMPKNGLTILNLDSGQRTDMEKVTSYSLATNDLGWMLYRPEPAPKPATPPAPKPADPAAPAKPEDKQTPKPKADHRAGDIWVLRNLATGKEEKLENVSSTRWSKDGSLLVYTVSTADGAGDGVIAYDLKSGEKKTIASGLGKYPKLAVSDHTKDIAFATDKDDYAAKKPALSIYVWHSGRLQKIDTSTLNKDYVPVENGSFQFTEKGSRLIFGVAPKPEEEKKDDTPDDEKVSVDIWNWQDPQMMPQQIMQAAAERARTYDAIYDFNTGKTVQLENPKMRNVSISMKGDGDLALGASQDPYQKQNTWQEVRTDYYLVDPETGKATPLATNFAGSINFSPTGKYLVGYDEEHKDYFAIDTKSHARVNLNSSIPFPIWDEETDTPSMPNAFGSAGWLPNDRGLLLYDKYDIWLVDPATGKNPVNLTGGTGRRTETVYRMLRLDPEADFVDLSKPQMLSARSDTTKAAGYFRLAGGNLEKLMMQDKGFPSLAKAKKADVFAFQRMDVNEYPDVWLADAGLKNPRKVSEANPQQKDYNWCTSELVSWLSNDGQMLQGILYKPENFDATKKYPMIAYFYEKNSDTLHQYYSPAPSASVINITMYCSQGYLVFVPDIPYKVGYPGESAVSAIVPGVQAMVARGYVDPKRLGIQGQSWGGYETGYLVTETNMFAAACAGAPVSNMVSAYGGIRWESGVSREGQYEHGQSRIGGSLWENPLRFIENSPIFFVDKIKTPLLIMSNDKDGAVPWYQGIEYFSAMRRLNKPCWLVCYNEEQHNLVQRKNRKDWSIRMQQFFDHYLKGAPMPVWMAQGVPATMKGKTYGFETVPVPGGK